MLTAELALALARAATARVARERWRRRACSSSATRASRARCSRPPSPPASPPRAARRCSAACCRPRARRCCCAASSFDLGVGALRLAQPVPRQRHQVLRRRRLQALRRRSSRRSSTRSTSPPGPSADVGRVRRFHGALEDYLRALHERFAGLDLSGPADRARLRQRRDLPGRARRSSVAWAPTSTCSPPSPTGATSTRAAARPTSTALAEHVAAGGHDAGFAFDGDGDRVLAVDRNGAVVDGDELIALAALHLRAAGRLPGDGVAVTVMTNYGFHTAMAAAGVRGRHDRRSATATCSRRCASAAGRSAASSPATSSRWASTRPATGSPAALLTLEALARRRPRGPRRDGEAARRRSSTCASRDREALADGAGGARGRRRARRRRSRAAAACSCAPAAPSRSSA